MLRKTPKYERIAFVASPAPEARKALKRLVKLYGNVAPSRADVVVALGGDGLMLRTLRQAMKAGRPIYGPAWKSGIRHGPGHGATATDPST